jgi:NAD(P)-dependent dehydrogenase (short-subunit alcohol dehydrogenase family)
MSSPFSLRNKTILITGASSGIGRCTAIECSKLGARLVITGRSRERLLQTFRSLEGGYHKFIDADLTCRSDIDSLVAIIDKLDGIVFNAGVSGKRELCKYISTENLIGTMSTNLYGPILLQRAILEKKKISDESSIVFIASRAPFSPSPGNSVYSMSKGAMLAYAKVLALEMAPRKIRVNSICPAMVRSDFLTKNSTISNEAYESDENLYPLKRYGIPEDIAFLAIYLLSDASKWMTGSSIDITGGGTGLLS